MSVYTYSSARQHLAAILEEAKTKPQVYIKRKNGDMFQVLPVIEPTSPLDVPSVKTKATTGDVLEAIRTSRKHGAEA